MQCPVCQNIALVMSERQGVEIDYCPQCRGIWLDRGELDKIIERSNRMHNPNFSSQLSHKDETRYQQNNYDQKSPSHGYFNKGEEKYHNNRPKKKESFLGELFDF